MLARMGLQAHSELPFTARYNIAPTQDAWIAALSGDGSVTLKQARWGLIPFWAKDRKIASSLINARSETVAQKPAFRSAYAKSRCLVLGDGFFEWMKQPGGKQPIYIRLKEGAPFAFGGLREQWQDGERLVETFCIITVAPNEVCARVHDRMPLILRESDFPAWLDPGAGRARADSLLRPYDSGEMECFPVSARVNSARNEGPPPRNPGKCCCFSAGG